MMKLLTELKVKPNYSQNDIFDAIEKKYHVGRGEILRLEILKESIDARRKPMVYFSLNVAVEVKKSALNRLKNCSDCEVSHDGLEYTKVDIYGNEKIASAGGKKEAQGAGGVAGEGGKVKRKSCGEMAGESGLVKAQVRRPVVVGFGPSGIFAGLALALMGLKPIILEQGKKVKERQVDVSNLWKNRKLNKYSNVQFGEGGAGTFSDGKLASNVSNEYTKKVINEFVLCGAPKEIFYSGTPHIGSDKLKEVVTNLRKKIEENGGEVIFNTRLEDFEFEDETKTGVGNSQACGQAGIDKNEAHDGQAEIGKSEAHEGLGLKSKKLSAVVARNVETGEILKIQTDAVILAVGHSATNVFELLKKYNCQMKQKPFALGVRIEQSQSSINLSQYGRDDSSLPSANYKLVTHLENGRSVFTFCMCPGGQVVCSASEEGTVSTNGMSEFARDGENANSALLVNVTPDDYESTDPLAGLEFQKKYEKLAFELGGRNFSAPAQKVKDFLGGNADLDDYAKNENEYFGRVKPTYLPAVKPADISKCLPKFVSESLRLAIPKLNLKFENFAQDDDILIGVESRSSSAVQVVRDENFMTSLHGIFACGEGSGYAGGITSSAQDGIKCAESVARILGYRHFQVIGNRE